MTKLFFTCIFLVTISSVSAQSKSDKLDSIFTLLHQNDRFNGSILVAEKGIPIFSKSFGLANVEQNEKSTDNTIYKLNSISKQFTALGIIILKNEGKLKLNDHLSRYIPELKFYENVTIQNLLNHTHGIPEYSELFEEKWDKTKIATNNDVIKLFEEYQPPKHFQPGEKFLYGSIGYELLAVIIERVSNQTYNDFLTQHLFTPLRMENTFDHHALEMKKNMARGYVYSDSLQKRERPELLGNHPEAVWSAGIYGSGTIHTTTADMLKWDRALYDTTFVATSDLQLMYHPTTLNDGNEINYGFAWWLTEKGNIGKIAYHAGNSNGFETHFERHIDSDKTIIILQNFDATTPAIDAVNAILYNQPLDFVISRKEIKLNESVLKQYEGEFAISATTIFSVFVKNQTLFVQPTGQRAIELCAENESTFFVKKIDVQFEFITDDHGQLTKMFIYQNGNKMEAIKK